MSVFAGCSSASNAAELTSCIEAIIECETCKALNATDGLTRNCDQFDDGDLNGSCQ